MNIKDQVKITTLFLLSFSYFSNAEDVKHGPRFDYYNLRKKPMRHGLVFRDKGANEVDDLVIKTASATNGKKIYTELCIHCHGKYGEGDGTSAQELVLKPADLSKLSTKLPGYHFFIQTSEGTDKGMPAWQEVLTQKELWDLVAYIKTLKFQDKKK